MAQTQSKETSDYNSRSVAIQVTGVRRQDLMHRSNYTVRVPYTSMSKAIQNIHRIGGKITSISVDSYGASSSDKEAAEQGVTYPQLQNKNPRLRERAMREIAKNRTEETIPQLMAILSAADVVYRRAAVQTLGVIGLDAVPSLAEQLVNSENDTVRASCAKALAAIALKYKEETFPAIALEALEKALRDTYPVVQISAVGALSTVGSPALPILQDALAMENLALQVAAIGALGSIGDTRAVEPLSALANNPDADPYIKESAESALSRLDQVSKMSQRNLV
ncbi:MAG: HEAT repeat domain-containing protein [Oscillatoria sp. SIO1A7]|nr:HEAT repeat domain-containing protein [Oscillatoria sp. SIO1A7]